MNEQQRRESAHGIGTAPTWRGFIHRVSWTLVNIFLIALTAASLSCTRRPKPIREQILAADRLEFLGEDFPADGGSKAFFFHLPRKQHLMLLVLHRRPKDEGGNPDFQEILAYANRGYMIEVAPASELEKKLITLLRNAVINTNDVTEHSKPPKPERLQWVIERMQDRKTKW